LVLVKQCGDRYGIGAGIATRSRIGESVRTFHNRPIKGESPYSVTWRKQQETWYMVRWIGS